MFLTIVTLTLQEFKDLSMIHDSYGCHAPLVGAMRNTIRQEFYNMHKENLLAKFHIETQENIGKMLPEPPPTGDLDISLVLLSDYFFS